MMGALYTLYNWLLWVRIHLYVKCGYKFNKRGKSLGKSHELTFLDDFNKKELNRDFWRTDNHYGLPIHPGNITAHNTAPDVIYTDTNHIISDGKIYLYTKKQNTEYHYVDYQEKDWGRWTVPYRSGQIQQRDFEQMYGYFEACISVPTTPGTCPAFWLCSKHAWPPEIDVFKFYTGKGPNYFESNLHYGTKRDMLSNGYNIKTAHTLNVWAVDWTDKYIKMYFNNVLIRVICDEHVINSFDVPMFIVINNGIDTVADRQLENMECPNFLIVDWVRVWKKL